MNTQENDEIRENEKLYLRTLGATYRRALVENREEETRKPCKIVFIYSQN